MVDEKILWNRGLPAHLRPNELLADQFVQAVFKIAQKDLAAFAGEQTENVIIVFLQVLQEMTEYRFRCCPVRLEAGGVGAVGCAAENMPEELFAQLFQQIILCLKVSVEGGAAYIGPVNDLLDSDPVIIFFRKQSAERGKYSVSCLFLASVHMHSFPGGP